MKKITLAIFSISFCTLGSALASAFPLSSVASSAGMSLLGIGIGGLAGGTASGSRKEFTIGYMLGGLLGALFGGSQLGATHPGGWRGALLGAGAGLYMGILASIIFFLTSKIIDFVERYLR